MNKNNHSHEKPITVLIVDDNTIYRDGLCDLIAHWEEFQIIGLAGDGSEALKMYREHHPDLVLMDVSMPVMAGPEALKCIVQEYPDARIVMMTVTHDDPELLDSIQLGACGYMLKETSSQQLKHLLLGCATKDSHCKVSKLIK